MGVVQTPRSVVLALLFTFQYLGDCGGPGLLGRFLLPREFGLAVLFVLFEAFVAGFESPPRSFSTGFLVGKFLHAPFGCPEIGC